MFGCCLFVSMFHNQSLNNLISKLQEKALRLIYKDKTSSFDELLKKGNTFIIRQRNNKTFVMKRYKVKHKIAPKRMCELCKKTDDPFNLPNDYTFRTYTVKTVQYST